MKTKKILLIEDDDYFGKVIKIHLEREGMDVYLAQDAETGLAELPKIKPACVLLDVLLPGMDGFEACFKIKSDVGLKGYPVIMLTGKSKIKHFEKAFEVGAEDYIVKDVPLDRLLKTLTEKISQHSV